MGQLASNMGNPNITGPQSNQANWGDMDSSEKGARLLAGGTKGLSQGFQNYQQQNSQLRQPTGGGMSPMPEAQPVDSSYFLPQQKRGPNNLAFYGGPNG